MTLVQSLELILEFRGGESGITPEAIEEAWLLDVRDWAASVLVCELDADVWEWAHTGELLADLADKVPPQPLNITRTAESTPDIDWLAWWFEDPSAASWAVAGASALCSSICWKMDVVQALENIDMAIQAFLRIGVQSKDVFNPPVLLEKHPGYAPLNPHSC